MSQNNEIHGQKPNVSPSRIHSEDQHELLGSNRTTAPGMNSASWKKCISLGNFFPATVTISGLDFRLMENDKVCTLVINGDAKSSPTPLDLQKKIEQASSVYMQKKDAKKLIEALEELLLFMVNGNSYPRLLMTIIRFVITCDDHRVKKLLGLYWEICDKLKDNGELKEEMVLVCNAIRNDLIHANEYIRGRTLRLLCRMRYFKIIEPLIESILKNLSHRHAYVRRNAVTCVYSIFKTFGPDVIPQASVEIEQLLMIEGDLSTKRIAFIMLSNCDIDRAISYALSVEDQVTSLGDVFQLALLELVRKASRQRPNHKNALMRIPFYLASGSSPAVTFECGEILSDYGTSASSAHVATQAYVHLLNSQPDNNVKLVVLEKLERMHSNEGEQFVVEGLIMDIIRALSCPAIGVRRKIMALVTKSLNSRNLLDVVGFLKKEMLKTGSAEALGADGNTEYRRLLIQTMQHAARKFPQELAEPVNMSLIELLRESTNRTDAATANEVASFIRETMCLHEPLRAELVTKIASILPDMSRSRVIRTALWLLGEFSESGHARLVRGILDCIGPLPVSAMQGSVRDLDFDKEAESDNGRPETNLMTTTKTVVLADGTYASKTVTVAGPRSTNESGIRNLIRSGDILLCNVLGVVLAKLTARGNPAELSAPLRNETLFAITCLIRVVRDSVSSNSAFDLSSSRLLLALKVVAQPGDSEVRKAALREWNSAACRESLTELVRVESAAREVLGAEKDKFASQPNEMIQFRQIKERVETTKSDKEASAAMDWAPGAHLQGPPFGKNSSSGLFAERLNKAKPMTGLSDAVYVEGFLRLHSFDLILELTIVNRTGETLQNILVELCTNGDLKVVDKPQAVTLAPGESAKTFGTIKVSSTESALIFGYATFDRKSALGTKEWLVLNEVRADVLDYIKPSSILRESHFKTMWQDFEWENKIVVNTNLRESDAFINLIMKSTNFAMVGSAEEIIKSSQFVAVNMYAKSIFGEDALANVSLEKTSSGELAGTIRIRARSQGIALSLGDKINHVQREHKLRGA